MWTSGKCERCGAEAGTSGLCTPCFNRRFRRPVYEKPGWKEEVTREEFEDLKKRVEQLEKRQGEE